LGAGISGLSAASILKHFTKNLVVSEARDRIGGRINTQLMPGSNTPLDLGASWIHGIGKGVGWEKKPQKWKD
jgi:monoamine oxidase